MHDIPPPEHIMLVLRAPKGQTLAQVVAHAQPGAYVSIGRSLAVIAERIDDMPLANRSAPGAESDAEAGYFTNLRQDARRYRWLRARNLEAIHPDGVFANRTSESLALNGRDLDMIIDAAMDREVQP